MICAYLLHDKIFDTAKGPLQFYGEARTQNAKVCVCVCVYIRMYFVGLTSGRNLCCLGDNGVRPLNLNSETDISL